MPIARLARPLLLAAAALLAAPMAVAQKKPPLTADVVGSAASRNVDGTYDIRVTVRSADKGTEQYCDRVELLDAAGTVLFTIRVLKPHLKEQPFSVTSRGVRLPEATASVVLRARLRQGGAFGKERTLKLPVKKK